MKKPTYSKKHCKIHRYFKQDCDDCIFIALNGSDISQSEADPIQEKIPKMTAEVVWADRIDAKGKRTQEPIMVIVKMNKKKYNFVREEE